MKEDEEKALAKVKKELNTPSDHRYKTSITKMRTKGSKPPKQKCIHHKVLMYGGKKANFFRCMKVARTNRPVGRVDVQMCDADAEIWDDLVQWAMVDFYTERFPDAVRRIQTN